MIGAIIGDIVGSRFDGIILRVRTLNSLHISAFLPMIAL